MTAARSAWVSPVAAVLALAGILGVLARALPVMQSGFPLNDGGLLASMIEDLAKNGLLIPATTSYNGGGLPFAYPPLALELGAILHLLGTPTLWILHWLPLVISCLTIPAAYLLFRELLEAPDAAVAILFFAVIPRSYIWMISGGGLTRSLGFLLALLALWRIARYLSGGRISVAIQGGVLAGLALTSHLEAAVLVAIGAVVLMLHSRQWHRIGWLLAAALVAALVASPWLVPVLVNHGTAPFQSASASRVEYLPTSLLQLLSLQFTEEAYLALGSLLGIVGLVWALLRGMYWPLGWLVAIFLLVVGGAPTYAMVPWAVLVSVSVVHVVGPHVRANLRPASLSIAAVTVLLSGVWSGQSPISPLSSLRPEIRQAMAFVRTQPGPQTYLLVTGVPWGLDKTAEWFPYLTGKTSVATVQGFEFAGAEEWSRRTDVAKQVQDCAIQGVECIAALQDSVAFAAVFIPKGHQLQDASDDCCAELRAQLRASPWYTVTYDGPGATIAQVAARGGLGG